MIGDLHGVEKGRAAFGCKGSDVYLDATVTPGPHFIATKPYAEYSVACRTGPRGGVMSDTVHGSC
jgi:hypothetical protein